MASNAILSRLDFATGLAAALTLQRCQVISGEDERLLHKAFEDAFHTIETGIGEEQCRFYVILDKFHGISGDVGAMLSHWLAYWATRDSPDGVWRLSMEPYIAEKILLEGVIGGRELWMKAANAFIARMNQY